MRTERFLAFSPPLPSLKKKRNSKNIRPYYMLNYWVRCIYFSTITPRYHAYYGNWNAQNIWRHHSKWSMKNSKALENRCCDVLIFPPTVGTDFMLSLLKKGRLQTYKLNSWLLLLKMPDGNFFNWLLFSHLPRIIEWC